MTYHDERHLSTEPVVTTAIGPWVNTILFLAAMIALAGWVGYLLAGKVGAFVALGLAAVSSILGPRHADLILLRRAHAQRLPRGAAPELEAIVHRLAHRAGVPVPSLWLAPSDRPNAFTVGRDPDHASIVVTTALLETLDARELTGVLAHEVAHIRNRDILLMSFAGSITAMFASMGRPLWAVIALAAPILLIMAPGIFILATLFGLATLGSLLLQSALSREREFAADANAAWLTGDPAGLASALRRIEQSSLGWWRVLFGGLSPDDMVSPFQTHPPTSERVARLMVLARARGGLPPGGGAVLSEVLDMSPRDRFRLVEAPRGGRPHNGWWAPLHHDPFGVLPVRLVVLPPGCRVFHRFR